MSNTQRTGWAGWAVFAGILMIIAGALAALNGLNAVLSPVEKWAVSSEAGTFLFDVEIWGWWHLILGIVILVVGIFVLRGATWARVIAVILVALNAISQLAFFSVQPWWALIVIALDVIIIYALTVHGRELQEG